MAIKEKAGLIALVAGVLSFIGWVIPYIWLSIGPVSTMIWSWGLATITGLGPVPPAFVDEIVIAGVLIIISAIILLATGALARKREDNKVLGIVMAVAGILGLIGVFVPLLDPNISLMVTIGGGLSFGFYLPLIGSIIGIGAGAIAAAMK